MYDSHVLPVTGAAVVAMLPDTGADSIVQLAAAAVIGMVVWGVLYSLTAKASTKA
jgi:hypothetical protein